MTVHLYHPLAGEFSTILATIGWIEELAPLAADAEAPKRKAMKTEVLDPVLVATLKDAPENEAKCVDASMNAIFFLE